MNYLHYNYLATIYQIGRLHLTSSC